MANDPVTSILQDPRFKGQPITWEITPDQYDTIRRAWLTHVAAEERLFSPYTEDEWKAQMAVMLSVFADDCVMELVGTHERWSGQAQADAFYRVFIPSFSGMQWVPQALVIGPQGVLDVVNMTGRLERQLGRHAQDRPGASRGGRAAVEKSQLHKGSEGLGGAP